ncbi:Na(+)-translocating NADH-quinone reductase subunit C [Enhygromyxa salina]|uniref:Na(+)-translocating NADH-quinone reductase subunit C n=1 Tax=Enhygromyxa salina TaxID=215803 RepID=A0A0C2CPZ2_9BACT|nr:Na(+)-translocating NADH-quinone reductase subunit C [Enhygromyxa salina]KIG13236.1 Na(+)-translocating NADH-quinone reductase subunit C [Enhygromyxa salina]
MATSKKDSPGYIAGFAIGVCLVCSLGVSGAAIFLKDRQTENATVDRQKKVLDVAGLLRPGQNLPNAEIQGLFEQRLVPQLIDLKTGDPIAEVDGVGPVEYDPMKAAQAAGLAAPPNEAKVRFLPTVGKVYYLVDDKRAVKKIIIPVEGYGLWGFLFGYLAMEADGSTISGITYYKHAETPGLGGEVDNPVWKGSWKGKKAFAEGSDEVAIAVVKNASGEHQVDALSGATITSRGVTNMMEFWLGENGFGPFLAKVREQGPPEILGGAAAPTDPNPGQPANPEGT